MRKAGTINNAQSTTWVLPRMRLPKNSNGTITPGNMTTDIFIANTDAEIESCFPVFSALRPHLKQSDFLPQVRRQQTQSYQVLALKHDGAIKSVAGFRLAEFLAWGKVLYIDDLSTLPGETSRGFAGSLLDWLADYARSRQCQAVHLDSGYTRHAAHRLYLHKGFRLSSHHFAWDIEAGA
jgi:GNAT superfamily N-acetyltransferase